jgi:hypothetical protein
MARYSPDQIRDMKNRFALGTFAVVVGLAVYLVGPGLEKVAINAREHHTEPWAAERMVQVATVMSWTFRQRHAVALYEQFYLYYSGDEERIDFEEISEWCEPSYVPSIALRYGEDRPRPKRVGDERHPLLGQVLAAYAKHWEDQRRYDVSDHIWRCLQTFWPRGTPDWQAGAAGVRRALLRNF